DVHRDVALGILALQNQQLRHHVVGGGIVDLHAEEDDAVFEQLVVRVLALEAVRRALLELRQHVAAGGKGAGGTEGGCVHVSVLPYLSAPVPPPPLTSLACSRMWSTNPYSSASLAVNQRSRSPS